MNNGRLQVGNNQLLFDNQEGLDKYNKHLENINVLGQIQAKITQEIQSLSQARKEQIDADMKQISK